MGVRDMPSNPVLEWGAVRALTVRKNALLVMPQFPKTFWGLDYAFEDIISGPKYPLPPLSLITLASFLPPSWSVRVVDENVRTLSDSDLAWADVVMLHSMIVQLKAVARITAAVHQLGKPVVVGGPHPTIAPEHYPDVDYVHQGEVGDDTIRLILDLSKNTARPRTQQSYRTIHKVPLSDYPPPRYELVRSTDYLSSSLQFAVGCPFNCEFCDIIEIYGRIPRVKRPEQILAELDAIRKTGHRGSVFFVDDNFIGNLPKVKALLPHVLLWQQKHGFPFRFYTEASVNLAEHKDLLEAMRAAGFYAVFLGIETPDPEDLKTIQKGQNARRPLLESIRILQAHGLEIWAGLILGFDSDRPDTGDQIVSFVEASAITMAMVNLLNAPIGTQLWRRLKAEGRLLDRPPIGDNITDTNIVFRRGEEEVFRQFHSVWQRLYEPNAFLQRIRENLERTGGGRDDLNALIPWKVRLFSFPRMIWYMGIRASYRKAFWRLLIWSLRKGLLDAFSFQIGMAYHCIRFRDHVLHTAQRSTFASPQAFQEKKAPAFGGEHGQVEVANEYAHEGKGSNPLAVRSGSH